VTEFSKEAWSEGMTKLKQAADRLDGVIYPGDELKGSRTDPPNRVGEELTDVLGLLNEAERHFRDTFPASLV
jgi:hypothetical protein